ncbi:hypothetical protein D3C85_1680620 [compost metagenome]
MLQPHEVFGWQMTAHAALLVLRRTRQASRLEARSLMTLLPREDPIPPELFLLCSKLYLMQLAPASASLH